ncbi:hypothetical protein N7532_011157 [Penicillium argentinense]|uniref:Uncharacterized protein n=1 Tax=Penicillium argentinense TaxID=1131581 RepID=A0A9W9EHW8_9EURO|nr:uncharacterized protein N7532_011157 [Penicillium argentinense]KAJ5082114.1 hypothetical protein N7532_011157 [Penicillium argentinense]
MSNHEYYGEYIPEHLAAVNQAKQSEFTYNASSSFSTEQTDGGHSQAGPVSLTQGQWQGQDYACSVDSVSEGERSLGSTVIGGAGGAFFGQQVGKKSSHGIIAD